MSEDQSMYKNQDITIRICLVIWLPWEGKTMYMVCKSCELFPYYRIYSNVAIKRNNKKYCKTFKSFDDLQDLLKRDFEKIWHINWVVILDEMWNNANAKDHNSIDNRLLTKMWTYARKYNVNFYVWIQEKWMLDINIRDRLAFYNMYINKFYKTWELLPFFSSKVYKKTQDWDMKYHGKFKYNFIKFMEINDIQYNTLEFSELKKANI